MKKLLGILLLGLLLVGCSTQKGNNFKIQNPYSALVELQKKGLNKTYGAYGQTRTEALQKAKDDCNKAALKVSYKNKPRCYVWGTYTVGKMKANNNWWPDDKGPKVYKAKKTESSGSKIDPSVWDDILGASKGILGGKSVSESLGGTSSNSSSSPSSITCFKKSESTTGTNKICIYNCMGSDIAINVKSTRLCPISVKN